MKRTILITGANGNLGQDVVSLLSAEGNTILATVGSGELSDDQKQKIAHVERVDLLQEEGVSLYVHKMAEAYPDLDAAVLLAGGFTSGDLAQLDGAQLDKQIGLNFKTALFVIRPLMEHFKKLGRGQFILIGARPAIKPEAGKNLVAYALSKSLIFSLAEIINAEGKDMGITASVIVPSTMDTEPNRRSMPQANFDHWVKTTDVAKTISFILSEPGSQLRQPIFKMYNKS